MSRRIAPLLILFLAAAAVGGDDPIRGVNTVSVGGDGRRDDVAHVSVLARLRGGGRRGGRWETRCLTVPWGETGVAEIEVAGGRLRAEVRPGAPSRYVFEFEAEEEPVGGVPCSWEGEADASWRWRERVEGTTRADAEAELPVPPSGGKARLVVEALVRRGDGKSIEPGPPENEPAVVRVALLQVPAGHSLPVGTGLVTSDLSELIRECDVRVLRAGRLRLEDGDRGSVTLQSKLVYIRDFDVEVGQGMFFMGPIRGSVPLGLSVELGEETRGCRPFAWRYAALDRLDTFTTTFGNISPPVTIYLPEVVSARGAGELREGSTVLSLAHLVDGGQLYALLTREPASD